MWHTTGMSKIPFLLPDLDALDPAALKAMICLQHAELISHKSQIEHLELLIAKLRRMQFGRKSEKLDRQIEQLELKLEDLQADEEESAVELERRGRIVRTRPERKPLPPHLPREEQVYMPDAAACPDCGGDLRQLGEDVSEQLEFIPASFKVIRHIRHGKGFAGVDPHRSGINPGCGLLNMPGKTQIDHPSIGNPVIRS